MEPPFDAVRGVSETIVGYTGGTEPNPTYELISTGTTDYVEAVQVLYDPAQVSYEHLLDVFWRNIDPTQSDGQFADRGPQYATAIFYHNDEQRRAAESSKLALGQSGKFSRPIVTKILPASEFYQAEEYHQDYYRKNETRYNLYKIGSGRAGFIERTWKMPKGPEVQE
jgi:peptide methionine sulfoxide reductase msrA/msrB